MVTDRPYRRALPLPVAIGELEANAGTQFDPTVVSALVDVTRGHNGADASDSTARARGAPARWSA
jgi:HD-GYP domain-containing protein (c-di-GMP phosphodiesterase class II)